MRDKLKTKEYFENFINEEKERIAKFQVLLNDEKLPEFRKNLISGKCNVINLNCLIAKYSKGEDLDILKNEMILINNEWFRFFDPDMYYYNLTFLSLNLLLGTFDNCVDKIKNLGVKNDWLLNFLIIKEDGEMKLLFPKNYKLLQDSIRNNNKNGEIKKYLSSWFSHCNFANFHKSDEKLYFGYWSFEAGAIAKILGIDDSDLKDEPYYPYDLVHYCD